MKICLVNFAKNIKKGKGYQYPVGAARLKRTFLKKGYDGDFAFYTDEKQLGCPLHTEIPYTFKVYALMENLKKGYDILIWADCYMMLVVPFSKVLDIIMKHGYILPLNGSWNTGEWCADSALKPLGITREESFTYPHLMSNFMAFDCRRKINIEFLNQFYAKGTDGITFKGDWNNRRRQVSKDRRVLGHRHDQTAASIIACKLGMDFTTVVTYELDSSKWQDTILILNDRARKRPL